MARRWRAMAFGEASRSATAHPFPRQRYSLQAAVGFAVTVRRRRLVLVRYEE